MLPRSKDQLTPTQVAVIVCSYLLGSGTLSLPRVVTSEVGTPDGWLSVLIAGFLFMWLGYIMAKLGAYFPGKTIYEFGEEIVGKWLGLLISIFIIVYFLSELAFETRMLVEITKTYLLENTPREVTLALFLFIVVYIVVGGIHPIARLFGIFLPITIIVLVFILLLGLKLFDINQLRPFMGQGIIPVIKGILPSTRVYLGIEGILIISAFTQNGKPFKKAVLAGIALPMLLYVMVMIIVMGSLSVEGVSIRIFPTIDFIRSYEIEGLLFERFETLLLTIWILQIFTVIVSVFYVLVTGLACIFHKREHAFIYGILPVIYILSLIPRNMNEVSLWGDWNNQYFLMLCGISFILLLIQKIREKR
ncbi:GerAB/ArcD/ProY family transporter [Thermoflavimicrobium daqui]|uniref:GerAB/ArcD/ProY family transporter n=1 Tax=Thermoflavimicrobium daqui TaxID=2137476 RepID=UPI00143D6768|nr:GerAB/ArcD/ProY family transporter [Thermoflavimicrobium daqui]